MSNDNEADAPDYQSTLKSVESLVQKLEDSDTPLEQTLEYFEQGILQIRMAQALLAEAEQRVTLLVEGRDGKAERTALGDGDGDDESSLK